MATQKGLSNTIITIHRCDVHYDMRSRCTTSGNLKERLGFDATQKMPSTFLVDVHAHEIEGAL